MLTVFKEKTFERPMLSMYNYRVLYYYYKPCKNKQETRCVFKYHLSLNYGAPSLADVSKGYFTWGMRALTPRDTIPTTILLERNHSPFHIPLQIARKSTQLCKIPTKYERHVLAERRLRKRKFFNRGSSTAIRVFSLTLFALLVYRKLTSCNQNQSQRGVSFPSSKFHPLYCFW